MLFTSAEAAKLLRKLNDEINSLQVKENKSREFLAAVGEDPESVRPAYDYETTKETLTELKRKVRRLKHAINRFNVSQSVPGFDMTIDEILVYIPQLSAEKEKLAAMKDRLPKERVEISYGHNAAPIDYRYVNYDITAVERDYDRVSEELSRAQLALDAVNSSERFEAEL